MPSDRRAGWVLVDEGHRDGIVLDAGPCRRARSQVTEVCREWTRGAVWTIVGQPEEGDASSSHDSTHLEVGELDGRKTLA